MFNQQRFISQVPKCEIFIVSKGLVTCLIEMHSNNRKIRKGHVDYLKRSMIRGAFYITNNGIGISRSGEVIDGQHRLEALVDAGYPQVQILIVYGLPEESKTAIDLGINRTIGDTMHLAFSHPEITSQMVAVCRFYGLILLHRGERGFKPTPHEVFDWYNKLLPSFEMIYQIKGITNLPAPVITAVAIRLLNDLSDSRPLDFIEGLITGANLDFNSPILKLKQYLQNYKGGAGQLQKERFSRTISALTAYLENRTLTKLYNRKNAEKLLEIRN